MKIGSLRTLVLRLSYVVSLLMLFATVTRRAHAFNTGWCNTGSCSGGICTAAGTGNGYCGCFINLYNIPGDCGCMNSQYYGQGNSCT